MLGLGAATHAWHPGHKKTKVVPRWLIASEIPGNLYQQAFLLWLRDSQVVHPPSANIDHIETPPQHALFAQIGRQFQIQASGQDDPSCAVPARHVAVTEDRIDQVQESHNRQNGKERQHEPMKRVRAP